MSINTVKPRSATVQPTLSDLLATVDNKTGTLRYSETKELHIKRGFSLSGLRVKMGDKAALRERSAQRAAAAEHIKSAIDAEYGKGMGKAVFEKLETEMHYDLKDGVRYVALHKMSEIADELAIQVAEDRLGGGARGLLQMMGSLSDIPLDRKSEKAAEPVQSARVDDLSDITLDTDSMQVLRTRMARAILDLGDKSTWETSRKSAEGVLKAEAASYQAFRMAPDQALLSLQLSESYTEAPTEEKRKAMEGKLYELLQDPVARRAIASEELSPEEAVRDANFLLSYGMTAEKAMKSLKDSDLYKAAQQIQTLPSKDGTVLDNLKGQMTPRYLESYLKKMLEAPSAREAIKNGKPTKLEPAEATAIYLYGYQAYTDVQAALRGDDKVPKEYADKLVNACRSGFAKLPALPPQVTFRGTPFFSHEVGKDKPPYKDPAFVSTSTKEDIARENFSEGKFLLKVKTNASCRDVSGLMGNAKEAEVLFLPGTTFKATSSKPEQLKDKNGVDIGTLTVVEVEAQ